MSGSRPLEGLRVIELGQLLAGPFAGTILGYFGAEVIKVEPPTGDPHSPMARSAQRDVTVVPLAGAKQKKRDARSQVRTRAEACIRPAEKS